jgi:ribosome biogenesis protein MAK21
MQPAASIGNDGNATVRRMKGGHNDGLGPGGTVNDEEFWSKKVQDVPATQVRHTLRLSC